MILDVRETKPNASLKELIEDYKSFKGEEILAHQEIFEKEYLFNETLRQNAKEAVTIMILELSISYKSYRLNQQLGSIS